VSQFYCCALRGHFDSSDSRMSDDAAARGPNQLAIVIARAKRQDVGAVLRAITGSSLLENAVMRGMEEAEQKHPGTGMAWEQCVSRAVIEAFGKPPS
jgi:hypothetical protein